MKIAILAISLFATYFLQIPNMTGKWVGFLKTPSGDSVKLIYNFLVKEEKLFGSLQGPEGTAAIEDGKIKDSAFSFIITGNKVAVNSGKYYGDSVSLDVALTGGMNFHLTLKRRD